MFLFSFFDYFGVGRRFFYSLCAFGWLCIFVPQAIPSSPPFRSTMSTTITSYAMQSVRCSAVILNKNFLYAFSFILFLFKPETIVASCQAPTLDLDPSPKPAVLHIHKPRQTVPMAKKPKGELIPTAGSVPNRDLMQRLSFLYQSSVYLDHLAGSSGQPLASSRKYPQAGGDSLSRLSHTYVKSMRVIGKKALVKLCVLC